MTPTPVYPNSAVYTSRPLAHTTPRYPTSTERYRHTTPSIESHSIVPVQSQTTATKHYASQRPVAGGYQGGSVGSSYPGYPTQSNYPSQAYYPNQGYPSQGYPSQGYPNQGYQVGYQQGYPGGYQQGYPGGYQQGYQGGYQQGYPGGYQQGPPGYQQGPPGYQQGYQGGYQYQQGGYPGAYNGYQQPQKPAQASNPIIDKITSTLTQAGLNYVKDQLLNKNAN